MRSCGILLHVTSLPTPGGIGTMATAYSTHLRRGLWVGSCRRISPHISTQGTHCRLNSSPSQGATNHQARQSSSGGRCSSR